MIIALIAGGILIGRDLIQTAKIRAQISQIEDFKTAVNTFRAKYNCIPGDCPYATQFFGAVASTTANCIAGISDGTLTCNGNGDGLVTDTGYPRPHLLGL